MAENIENINEKESEGGINLRDLYYMCLSHWHWFAISLVICLGLAVCYLLRTPKVYSQRATVLIKETTKGRSSMKASDPSNFADFGMFTTNVNMSNEMIQFGSSSLMEEVVKRLSLEMNYKAPGRFHKVTLYGKSLPIEVRMPDASNKTVAAFEINLLPDNKVKLEKFKTYTETNEELKFDDVVEGVLADTLSTPVGPVILLPSKFYEEVEEPELIYFSKATMTGTVEKYQRELSVTQPDEKASVVNLRVNDVSVQRADDILASLIAVYNENWVRDKNQIAVSTSMFIHDRLGIITNELSDVDTDISSFKSQHLMPDVQTVANMYMDQANQAEQNILELNNQVYMCRYVRNYLVNDGNKNQLLPFSGGLNDNLTMQVKDYNAKVVERNQLANVSSDKNPLVKEMDTTLADMRSAMIASVDNQIVSLEAQIKSLQGIGNRATSQIASNPSQAKDLLSFERQQKVKENLYLFLLQKREENELSQAFTAYNTRIIEAPGGNTIPVAPVKSKILLVAFVIGMLIPIAILYIKEMTNTVVRGRKDLEKLPLPFVGEIPIAGAKKKGLFGIINGKREKLGDGAIVVKTDSRNVINEAFRVVRTNLEFMLGKDEHHVVALTSANPGSGKTFISFNLAASLALKKKKVIVIDLDLRRASLSKYANRPKPGIAEYLAEQINDPSKIIYHNVGGFNMDIIPVGILPPNPTELLFSPRLAQLIDDLRKEYDFVFLDCPPVEIVADAAIINKLADKTIFVIRAGLFERAMIPEVAEFYNTGKYQNLCLLLNGTESAGGRYGSRYGYRYGYKYGGYTKDE